MNNTLKYKGFTAVVQFCCEEGESFLWGKIEGINDLVTFEADNTDSVVTEFEAAVDDYIETCEMVGKKPEKSMSGSFNVRLGERLHRELFHKSVEEGCKLNDIVKRAAENYLATAHAVAVAERQFSQTVAFNAKQEPSQDSNVYHLRAHKMQDGDWRERHCE